MGPKSYMIGVVIRRGKSGHRNINTREKEAGIEMKN